jgi:hypothetical protein
LGGAIEGKTKPPVSASGFWVISGIHPDIHTTF